VGIEDDGRRRGGTAAVVVGVVALAALAVCAVVAFGPSSGADTKTAAAHSGSSTAGSAALPGTSGPSGTPATAPAPGAPHSAQPPVGRVEHGVHAGDLRFFLLPAPKGADVYGSPAGSSDTADDVAAGAPDQDRAQQALASHGFRAAAGRTYLTADGDTEVTVELARFGTPDQAAGYYTSSFYQAPAIALQASHPARGYDLASGSAESADTLLAVSYEGDVHITLSVTGARTPSPALLRQLLDAQYQRLKSGR
jgi:hypothetical protein